LDWIRGQDAIIHLAGDPIANGRWSAQKKDKILRSREDGSRHIADALERLPENERPRTWISAAAIGIYGNRENEVLTEASVSDQSPPVDSVEDRGAAFLREVCIRWEAQTLRPIAGVRSVALRLGGVIGPGEGLLAALLPMFRLGVGGPVGNGNQWMSWIQVEDVTGVILYTLKTLDLSGPVNCCSPQPVTNRDFARALGRAVHRPAALPAPAFALRAALGQKSTLVLSSQKVMPARLQASGFHFQFASIDSALKATLSK
jgi:uncharacterized protein (TIGR01777 family)